MIPTMEMQLKALRKRFLETVMPYLPEDAAFAKEQANLMLATFDWMIDTHQYTYRYEVIENVEYRNLVSNLAKDAGALPDEKATVAAVQELLAEKAPRPDEGAFPMKDLINQNVRLKGFAEKLFQVLTTDAGTDLAKSAKKQVGKVASLQERRERAFYRFTGFYIDPEAIDAVIADYAK